MTFSQVIKYKNNCVTESRTAGGTTKVKVSPPGQSVAAAKKAVTSGGKSLVDEDTGTTVGEHLLASCLSPTL